MVKRFAVVLMFVALSGWLTTVYAQQQSGASGQPQQQQRSMSGQSGAGGQTGQPSQQPGAERGYVLERDTGVQSGAGGQAAQQGQSGQPALQGAQVSNLQQVLSQRPGDQLIQGQIVKTDDRDVNDQEHRFLTLRSRTGQTIQVDLGLTDNLPDGFEVRENQWVLLAGQMSQVGNQQMFVAHTVANVFNLATRGGVPPSGDPQRQQPQERQQQGSGASGSVNVGGHSAGGSVGSGGVSGDTSGDQD